MGPSIRFVRAQKRIEKVHFNVSELSQNFNFFQWFVRGLFLVMPGFQLEISML